MLAYILSLFITVQPSIKEAKQEFREKIRNDITCHINITKNVTEQAVTNRNNKTIRIRKDYWNRLDPVAQRVTVIRELLHCELGIPYMLGMSIMNKKITVARMIYKYGAD